MEDTTNETPAESYWLCPLYSFDCDCDSVDIAEGIQIKRIPREFARYLLEQYSDNLKTIPGEAEWLASLPYNAHHGYTETNDLFVDLITALRLHQKGRIVAGLLTLAKFHNFEWTIGGHTSWTSVSNLDFFQETPIYKLRHSDLPEVSALFQQIRRWREARILNSLNIALERFHSAYHGPIEDRIIDQMIAFESLYLGNEQELTYKLAVRTAFLLRKRKDHRRIIFANIKEAYKYRSRIVHGDNPPSRDELRPIVSNTGDYLRQSIQRFLLLLSQGNSLKEIREKLLDENILTNGKLLAFEE